MSLSIKDVEDLAELAKLELSNEEKESLLADMESILGYVKQIEEVEVGEVRSNDTVYNVWREDVLAPREFSRELIVKQFPDSQDGFLKVKKIL
ncbi:MAG: Asp-tRNA(Asn)/Glu-tRNA(Gln) amidotransferase subunit GatC [Patescibacteria group bacterium]